MPSPDPDSPWYRDGLAFSCTRCGACCTGGPGYVWVSPEEIEELARFRGENGPAVLEEIRQAGRRSPQPGRASRRRLHLLGRPGGVHGVSRPSGSVPDLAVLARECRDARGLEAHHPGLPGFGPRASLQSGGNHRVHRDDPTMIAPRSPKMRSAARAGHDSQRAPGPVPGPRPRLGPARPGLSS